MTTWTSSTLKRWTLQIVFAGPFEDIRPRHARRGLSEFRRALIAEEREDLANYIEQRISPFHDRIKAVLGIRSQSLVHNERILSREQVYEINGIIPNQIRELIGIACGAINHVASELGISNTIFDSDRGERATMKMLEVLQRGNT